MSLATLESAERLFLAQDHRGSVNRSYYAAYQAATSLSVARGDDFAQGRNNPSHDQLPELIRNNGDLPVVTRRRVSRLLGGLRHAREDADYRPGVTVDRTTALDSLHQSAAVLNLLETDNE
jgi:uncharacterized protein (UPF0332 family)